MGCEISPLPANELLGNKMVVNSKIRLRRLTTIVQGTAQRLSALSVILCAATIVAEERRPDAPEPGATVSAFSLKDVHRRPHALAEFKEKKAIVVAFLGAECPLAKLAVPRLIELHEAYAEKGVQFLAIYSNEQDGFVEVSGLAQEQGIPFPVLKDFDQKVADSIGATRTPEFFVLDSERVIRYHGRLDDQFSVGFQRPQPKRHDLKEALDELLAGKAVSTPSTPITGCLIGRASKPRLKESVTYSKQVSRIVQQRCQECHRPGQIGPMSLLTYNLRKDAPAIARSYIIF